MFTLIAMVIAVIGALMSLFALSQQALWLFVAVIICFFLFMDDCFYWVASFAVLSWAFITVYTFPVWFWMWAAIVVLVLIDLGIKSLFD